MHHQEIMAPKYKSALDAQGSQSADAGCALWYIFESVWTHGAQGTHNAQGAQGALMCKT